MYKKSKPMLTTVEQIKHLEDKGIKFELISKENAKKYLENNNYYYKLVSYRKNFPKYKNGINKEKYINLDFEMLKDLSIIDMRIRKTMLIIVLDIEHYVKVKLLHIIENTTNDGYKILEEYIQELKVAGEYEHFENELNRNKNGIYCGNLIKKYQKEYPVWVFLEIISFGRLINFYRFVAKKLKEKVMIDETYMLKDIKELRNACAHNNCIINDLRTGTNEFRVNQKVNNELIKIGISKKIRDNKMSNSRMRQIITLLFLNKRITSSNDIIKYQTDLLKELKERIEYHIDYYNTNSLIKSNFVFLNKIIDKWYSHNI